MAATSMQEAEREFIQVDRTLSTSTDAIHQVSAAQETITPLAEFTNTTTDDTWQQLLNLLDVGGPVVWILSLFSIAALTIALVKCLQFYLSKTESKKAIDKGINEWQRGNILKAAETLHHKTPVADIVLHAMQFLCDLHDDNIQDTNVRQRSLNVIKDELTRQATQLIQSLKSYLRPLEMIAYLSPLLGLLGTVLGMIEAFQQMEAAGKQVDPSVLSGGIWQALLTTAVGLAVAIPVVIIHGYFDRKCERIAQHINDSVTRVFSTMPRSLEPTKDDMLYAA